MYYHFLKESCQTNANPIKKTQNISKLTSGRIYATFFNVMLFSTYTIAYENYNKILTLQVKLMHVLYYVNRIHV